MKTLLKNGNVCDGSGSPAAAADILLENDRISALLPCGTIVSEDTEVIDVKGLTVTPGFIDIHRHHDAEPLRNPDFGHRELLQGITTAVSGNCGISLYPRPSSNSDARVFYDFEAPVMGTVEFESPVYPSDFRGYLGRLEHTALPLNTAAMIGTGSVRISVKGFDPSPYTDAEMSQAKSIIEDALDAGAPGISLGIMYLPECFTSTSEYIRLLKPVAARGRRITTHIRGEGNSMVDSVREVIEIARGAGCGLEISHFKSCGRDNWRKDIYRAVEEVEKARSRGEDVAIDFYPYDCGSTALTTMLPPDFVNGDLQSALIRLGTPEGVDEFRRLTEQPYETWDNYALTLGWERIIISAVTLPEHEKYLGLTMTEAAALGGFDDAPALAAHLCCSENGKTAIINRSMCQDDIDYIAKLPYASIISDSIYADTKTPHPRMYGAFPKVIREYVKERHLLTIEEAVRKMTSLPASRMNLNDRGLIKPGYFADLLVFDPDRFRDRAEYTAPAQYPTGLTYSFIAGKAVVKNDEILSNDCGRLIRA